MIKNLNIWPYIEYSLILKEKKRKGFGNMFRHQMETFGILIEFGHTDSVLIKAALIHDLFEDGHAYGFDEFEKIISLDDDGKAVYELVHEMTMRVEDGEEEPKAEFLERIMKTGSAKAKLLKLADRLANVNSLPTSNNKEFINRYTLETTKYIMPYAYDIDANIANEIETSLKEIEIRK